MKRIRTLLLGNIDSDQLVINDAPTGLTVGDVVALHDFAGRLLATATQWRALALAEERDERLLADLERDWQTHVARWNRP
jgi:hypothetical protein